MASIYSIPTIREERCIIYCMTCGRSTSAAIFVVPEIASITGHTLENANKILEKYLARTKAISDAAIFKFENAAATGFANRLRAAQSNT